MAGSCQRAVHSSCSGESVLRAQFRSLFGQSQSWKHCCGMYINKFTLQDHTVMLIFGVLLLLLGVLGFLAVCTYAVIVVPRWSSNGQHANVKAFRFLLFRFRLDSWWFGVLLLLRGPLMSLPIALATDYPPVQVMSVMLVFLVVLIIQANAWPWKVPLLNVLDCFIGFCITMLVASNSLYLGGLEGSMKDFADGAGSVIMGMMGAAVSLLFVMTVSALTFRAALGGQQELIAFNLQRTFLLVLLAFSVVGLGHAAVFSSTTAPNGSSTGLLRLWRSHPVLMLFSCSGLHLDEDAGAHPPCRNLAVHVSEARRDGSGRTGEGVVGNGSLRQQVAAGISVLAGHGGCPVRCRRAGKEVQRKGLL